MQLYIRNKIGLKFVIISAGLIAILISSNCKKEELPTYYVPDSVRAYVSFKEGSYWIYKDDSTGIEDSVWVTKFISKLDPTVNSKGKINGNEEVITCSLSISNSNLTGSFGARQSAVSYYLYDWSFSLVFYKNSSSWNTTTFYRDSIIIDSLEVDHVLNFTLNDNSIILPYVSMNMYIKSSIGFLKWNMIYSDGKKRQQHLIRYHINQ
jgi:hypothetical protein